MEPDLALVLGLVIAAFMVSFLAATASLMKANIETDLTKTV